MKHPVLAAAALGTALVAAPEAMAQAIRLEAQGPAENFVEWTGAHGANVVTQNIHGRVISVTATTNAPIELEGACPPSSSYPGWKLATRTADESTADAETGADLAEVDEDSVARTGENGTFSLRFTAPSRVGQTLRADVACVHDLDLGGAENIDQTEKLTAEITSVGAGSAGGSGFLHTGPVPGNETDEAPDSPSGGLPMNAMVGIAGVTATTDGAATGTNVGFLAKFEAGDEVTGGLVYRFGTVAEFARNQSGAEASQQRVDRTVHSGFAMVGWRPKPVPGYIECALDVGVGVTGAPPTTLESPYVPGGRARVREISAKIAGRAAAACRISGKNWPIRLELGVDDVFQPASDPLNSLGFYAGLNVKF